jgi:multidrug efflux pump subunit AcrB
MIRFFAGHPTAANLVMGLFLAAGLFALPTLQRETFPDFSVDAVQVDIVYPGASAESVEEALCQRIEDAVDGLTDLGELRCQARENLASATIEMLQGGDLNRFLREVNTEIDAIDNLPELTEDPVVRQINLADAVVSIAITGPMAEADLKVFAEQVKDRMIRLPDVSLVDLKGFSERQIRIELDADALRQYRLSAADISDIVARQSIDLPAGTIQTRERDILIRVADERRDPRAFEDLVILGSETGAEVTLGRIARITDRFELDEERVLFNGRRAALLEISKTKAQDVLTVRDAVEDFIAEERRRAPPDVRFYMTRDVSTIVRDRLDMLVRNGLQGLVLVILVMWLFFSFRLSFWVAMGLPVSFLGSILVMTLIGYSINMLTMVALLISIGVIMDDSIVIAENISRHRRENKNAVEAVIAGTRQVAMGVLSSFATSVCVFAPLAFLEGDIGKVLKVVPVVLIMTLAVSLIEAFLVLPHHLRHAERAAADSRFRRWFESGFEALRERVLGRVVDLAIRWRYLTLGLVIMAFLVSLAMVAGGALKFRAFPDLDGDVIEARVLLPQGTPLSQTETVVARVTEALGRVDAAFTPQQPDGRRLVENVLVRYNTNVDAYESGRHLATVTVDLLKSDQRTTRLDDLLKAWREEVGVVPDVIMLTFTDTQIGPAGSPIEIRLQGPDLGELKQASGELIAWLGRYRGVADLHDDLRPGKPEVRLSLREGATLLGLNAQTIGTQLRAAFHGSTASEIQVGPESFEIDVQLADQHQNSLADLDYFVVTSPEGDQVPLSAVARLEIGRSFSRIGRIDGRRTVVIRGDVDSAVANVNEILADSATRILPELARRYPGVEILLEGEVAEQATTQVSMLRGFLVGLFGIFLLLSFQFRDYLRPLIVMVTIPLALIGAIWGHIVMGLDFSMPSMLGFASLAGIVVNDSILLVLFVGEHRKDGISAAEAAQQASRARFRPVLLTSLTTIAGLLPLLFERSLQAQVLVPLVTSLAFGLLATTVLVLIVIPVLYAVLDDLRPGIGQPR